MLQLGQAAKDCEKLVKAEKWIESTDCWSGMESKVQEVQEFAEKYEAFIKFKQFRLTGVGKSIAWVIASLSN